MPNNALFSRATETDSRGERSGCRTIYINKVWDFEFFLGFKWPHNVTWVMHRFTLGQMHENMMPNSSPIVFCTLRVLSISATLTDHVTSWHSKGPGSFPSGHICISSLYFSLCTPRHFRTIPTTHQLVSVPGLVTSDPSSPQQPERTSKNKDQITAYLLLNHFNDSLRVQNKIALAVMTRMIWPFYSLWPHFPSLLSLTVGGRKCWTAVEVIWWIKVMQCRYSAWIRYRLTLGFPTLYGSGLFRAVDIRV